MPTFYSQGIECAHTVAKRECCQCFVSCVLSQFTLRDDGYLLRTQRRHTKRSQVLLLGLYPIHIDFLYYILKREDLYVSEVSFL